MKVYVGLFFGLGGSLWSGGMETVLRKNILKIDGVICPPVKPHGELSCQRTVAEIKALPKSTKVVVCGHSLGAVTATNVTDFVPVDLLILYDLAGAIPSKLGPNTRKCIDIYDTIPDIVPEWRVQTLKGYEKLADGSPRIERWYSRYGHTNQDDSYDLAMKVVDRIKQLANL